jgi:hypothetical protein
VHVGVADHLGWAIAVTARGDEVVDRRRIALVEPGLPVAPIHHEGGTWPQHGTPDRTDAELSALVARVRESAVRATRTALAGLPGPIESLSLRAMPDLPEDIAVLRRPPYESRADAVHYRRVLAEVAESLGWTVHTYDARTVEARSGVDLSRTRRGAPWTKDHRVAFAAAVLAQA